MEDPYMPVPLDAAGVINHLADVHGDYFWDMPRAHESLTNDDELESMLERHDRWHRRGHAVFGQRVRHRHTDHKFYRIKCATCSEELVTVWDTMVARKALWDHALSKHRNVLIKEWPPYIGFTVKTEMDA